MSWPFVCAPQDIFIFPIFFYQSTFQTYHSWYVNYLFTLFVQYC